MTTTVVNLRRKEGIARMASAILADERSIALVDRRSEWGNPFSVKKYGKTLAMTHYLDWLAYTDAGHRIVKRAPMLRGKTLACWCVPGPCHGTVLARLADGDALEVIRADMLRLVAQDDDQMGLFGGEA